MDRTLAKTDSDIEVHIREALIEMLHEQPLVNITVKDLARHANIARSTFYVHYRNVDEVLEQIENALVLDLTEINEPITDGLRTETDDLDFFRDTLDYLNEHRNVMSVLLVERADVRSIAAWKDGIKDHLRALSVARRHRERRAGHGGDRIVVHRRLHLRAAMRQQF